MASPVRDRPPLIVNTEKGLHCPAGGFYIDPWSPADVALITHAHSDHARSGSKLYIVAGRGLGVFRTRLGKSVNVHGVLYGERIKHNGVTVSFHPAGHVLGSAQIRVERDGEVWVVTGDYKRQHDVTCEAFELVPCHTLITECTFFDPTHKAKAKAGRHLHVDQLAQVLSSGKLKNQHIILTHVSRRMGVRRSRSILRRMVGDTLMENVQFLMDFEGSRDDGDMEESGPVSSDATAT